MTAYVKVAILNGSVEGETTNTDTEALRIYKGALKQYGYDPDNMQPQEIVDSCAVLANLHLWESARSREAGQAADEARQDSIDNFPPPTDTPESFL